MQLEKCHVAASEIEAHYCFDWQSWHPFTWRFYAFLAAFASRLSISRNWS